MMSVSDTVQFFSSAKGRLSRMPYNIAFIIYLSISFFFYIASEKVVMNVNPNTLSAMQQSFMNVCTEKSKRFFSPEGSASKAYVKQCVKDRTFNKLVYSNPTGIILHLITLLLWLVMICPGIRRLHDRGKSGWWYLGFSIGDFIPLINIIVGLWFLVETSFLRGTVGPNDYGPDPIGESVS